VRNTGFGSRSIIVQYTNVPLPTKGKPLPNRGRDKPIAGKGTRDSLASADHTIKLSHDVDYCIRVNLIHVNRTSPFRLGNASRRRDAWRLFWEMDAQGCIFRSHLECELHVELKVHYSVPGRHSWR
jgi:hypothetical protein